jgi:hypothetical protein
VLHLVASHVATHRDKCAHAKVGDLDRAVQPEQDVARFDVSVDVAVGVEIF